MRAVRTRARRRQRSGARVRRRTSSSWSSFPRGVVASILPRGRRHPSGALPPVRRAGYAEEDRCSSRSTSLCCIRAARRSFAARWRRRSISVSIAIGSTARGCPFSSSATKTKYAVAAWTVRPEIGFSASTRTPHSSEVVPTSFTDARSCTTSPTCTGSRNEISSTLTVTQRPSAWRIAASAAAVSASRIITPPCTLPATLASVTSISWVSVTWDALTGLGSPAVIRASYASGVTACGSRYRGREKRFARRTGHPPGNPLCSSPGTLPPRAALITVPAGAPRTATIAPMRPRFLAAVLVLATACGGAATVSSGPSGTPSPSPFPSGLPAGVPPSFGDAVGPGDVPVAALVPLKADVTGSWGASTAAGDVILVAWELPGGDPFRTDRGIAAWRRFQDEGAPWRPVWGRAYPSGRAPIQNLSAQIADVTGDGSDDAVILAETGGSGACGTTSVVDLATGSVVYRSTGCDRTVDPSADPTGLVVREAVYRPGDAHCCPSKVRTILLVDDGGTWETASERTTTP